MWGLEDESLFPLSDLRKDFMADMKNGECKEDPLLDYGQSTMQTDSLSGRVS